jgi:hypothetical protein
MPGKKLKKKEAKQAKKSKTRKTVYTTIAAAVVVVIVIAAYFAITYTNPLVKYINTPINNAFYSELYSVANSPYNVTPLFTNHTPVALSSVIFDNNQSPWMSGGKPIIVFIGGEYCPHCALTRWPLTLALLRFGNFTGLKYMLSTNNDIDPNTPTFTYLNSTYSSPYIVFQPFEAFDRSGNPLQTVPSNYSTVWSTLTGGADSVPFVDFANVYVASGLPIDPTGWNSYNWTQILTQIQQNETFISSQAEAYANVFTAVICKLDGNKPANVCGLSIINHLENELIGKAYSPLSVSLTTGYPNNTVAMWTTVQYSQTEWMRNSSVKTK